MKSGEVIHRGIFKKTTALFTQNTTGTVTGLSFGDCGPVENGLIYIVYSYCKSKQVFIQHVYQHLLRASRICCDCVLFSVFTSEEDQVETMHEMQRGFSDWIPNHFPRETVEILEHPFALDAIESPYKEQFKRNIGSKL